jgi:isoleucyl-tRNA synthetase
MADQTEPRQSNTPNFNDLEQDVLKYWDDNQVFEKSLEKNRGREPFIFYDGPPFATGLPHYGHMLASIVKDAVGRYQTMHGKYVRRRWGWDCHGMPIENIVEQKLRISGKKQIEEMGVEKFNAACRENVLAYVEEWGKMVKRMGRWTEFENSYKTMDTSYMESVWWAVKQVWEKGLIYEDRKVLMYCSRCETPVSNFEIAMDNSYRDVTEDSVFVKFKLLPKQRIVDWLTDEKTYALAWTTTPWTLPGNTALNIGPDITYVIVEQNGDHYILAKDRLEVLDGEYEIKKEFSARSLEGLSYEPLFPGVIENNGKAHKIYPESYVTTTDGTGIVHNAAMYGEEDYAAAKERDLPRMAMLDHKGEYLENAPTALRGLFFKDADPVVINDLTSRGLLYKVLPFTHSYPHCWRCGTPLFYNALPAWFINIQKIKPRLLELNEQEVNWYPAHLKEGRFGKSIETAPDWNISRNRFWATALPFWKCETADCDNVVCIGSLAELIEKSLNFAEVYPEFKLNSSNYEAGVDDQNLDDAPNYDQLDLHRPYIDRVKLNCDKCSGQMQRIPEVIDCWVESASMPFAELHYPFENKELFAERYPADFVAEYIAQTRAWFYVMHVMGTIINDKAPFKNVVTTGNILAEDGSKMSKSKNNYPDPWVVVEKYGMDPIRFYLLTSPVMSGDDLDFSEKSIAEINRKVSLLFYNVWSFYRMYTKEQGPAEKPAVTNVLDQWILALTDQMVSKVTKDMNSYNTVRAGRTIVEFINDLSTWYLRRSRDRIKNGGPEAETTLAVLKFVLAQTSLILAPFMPFLAEHIYRDLTGGESVHLENWPTAPDAAEEQILADMELVRQIVTVGHALRKDASLAVSQPLRAVAAKIQTEGDFDLDPELINLVLVELNVKEWDTSLVDKANLRPESIKTGEGNDRLQNVYLDIELTPELQQAGTARKLERHIQDMRKKAGLQVGELVDLYYTTTDTVLEQALVEMVDRRKTFINQIQTSLEVEADFEIQIDVAGSPIWLGIIKI